jgi:hypothetical protein
MNLLGQGFSHLLSDQNRIKRVELQLAEFAWRRFAKLHQFENPQRSRYTKLLLTAEENPKVIAVSLGNSTIVLTLDIYSHVLPTMQRNATDKLKKLLFP